MKDVRLIYSCICGKFSSYSEDEVQAHFSVHRKSYEKGEERYEKCEKANQNNASA